MVGDRRLAKGSRIGSRSRAAFAVVTCGSLSWAYDPTDEALRGRQRRVNPNGLDADH
ncbi:hypothetical protein [Kibdelosporangium philippinense]|uniref:hypothetical protein n=1 Tax=Kibdelosporangium philippinense TaxID=211113 RepID=UPI0036117F9D